MSPVLLFLPLFVLPPAVSDPPLATETGSDPLEELWHVPIGPGFSAPVLAGERVFVSHRVADSDHTWVRAVQLDAGHELWRASFPDAPHAKQEDYGGGHGPHATPLVHRGRLFVLGFGGRLVALDVRDGSRSWEVDLVSELGAAPVQFGFAASPLAVGERVVLLTGGEAGMVALDTDDGTVAWRSPARPASYATPVLLDVEGERHLVGLFNDATVGLDPSTGEELWSVPHVRGGQTNYASPVPLADGGLVVSGQGLRGARRIDVRATPAGWLATETWRTRGVQFSHGRVVEQGGFLYGSNGSMLCALSVTDGAIAFKQRGYGESNLVPLGAGERSLRLDEEGRLTLLRLRPGTLEVHARAMVLGPRSWAAPCVDGERLLLRDAERLVALRIPISSTAEAPLEVQPTGYRPGTVRVPRALLAFAQGRYGAGAEELELRADGGTLWVTAGEGPEVELSARSEQLFEEAQFGRIELLAPSDKPGALVPGALRWSSGGEARELPRQTPDPRQLDAATRRRWLGRWGVEGGVELQFSEPTPGVLEAISSAHPGLRFRGRWDGPDRLWLEALDAPYGLPPILVEDAGAELTLHIGTDSLGGERR